jgi:phenylalanyl-tRNA synthetase alpha chain
MSGWIELLGCGMVDPNVFSFVESNGYDARKVSGFAFGMGVERITMLKYGIDDIQLFYQGDVRFLEQFA